MYTELDIYQNYRQSQTQFLGRTGYKTPKDWVKYFTEKLSNNQQDNLTRASKYFSTLWTDVNPKEYFDCGFQLHGKRFSYHLFFDKKIMLLYKRHDKNQKNEFKNMKKSLVNSVKFVLIQTKNKKCINPLMCYCDMMDGPERHKIVSDYLKNNVCGYFLVWMAAEGWFDRIYDYESCLSFLFENKRDMYRKLYNEKEFLEKIKNKVM